MSVIKQIVMLVSLRIGTFSIGKETDNISMVINKACTPEF